jgi:opacity protein-like surface antigen
MKQIVIGIGLAAVLAVPGAAQAQEQKFVLRPMVGGVVGSGPGASYSAAIGFKAQPKLSIHGEFGRLDSILPTSVAEEVEVAAAVASGKVNGKHSATSSASAGYGMVGMRYGLREISGAATFLEAGVGMAHVTSTVDAVIRGSALIQGDISSAVHTPFTDSTPVNKPMVAVGGGFILGINKSTAIELGARYLGIFTDEPAIHAMNIFGGFRVGF